MNRKDPHDMKPSARRNYLPARGPFFTRLAAI